MKRFVVCTDVGTTEEQDQKFMDLLKSKIPEVGWWHQLSETWLIVDPSETLTVSSLRDLARQAWPSSLMVIEVSNSGNWSGFGPPTTMFPWMREWWKKKA